MSKTKMFSLRTEETRVCLRDFHDWCDETHRLLPVSPFLVIVTLKVNDGDPEHAALLPPENRERKEAFIWIADTAELYSPNILFRFVEFLSQIFSRGLTGDLNHGQLLAIASHVAGGLTHTVIVVFLYQKVCG